MVVVALKSNTAPVSTQFLHSIRVNPIQLRSKSPQNNEHRVEYKPKPSTPRIHSHVLVAHGASSNLTTPKHLHTLRWLLDRFFHQLADAVRNGSRETPPVWSPSPAAAAVTGQHTFIGAAHRVGLLHQPLPHAASPRAQTVKISYYAPFSIGSCPKQPGPIPSASGLALSRAVGGFPIVSSIFLRNSLSFRR